MDAVAWRRGRLSLVLLAVAAIAIGACTSGGGTTTSEAPASEAPMSEAPMSEAPMSEAPASEAPASPIAGGLLDKVMTAGKIIMSTDPQYPPQSELTAEGNYEGFDIDVGTEIAKRLGVEIAFETPSWDVITAGSWGGRWDFSVGSMTITSPRQEVLDFSDPYYYTPAQMAARTDSGITTLDGLAGKVICVGAATTYLDWLNGSLDFGTESPQTTPPEGATATTLDTDRLCAEAWRAGRTDFDGWLSSSTTVQAAIDDGLPVVAVGDPVFFEPLAVAFDKSGPDPSDMVTRVNAILAEMHADGTLKTMSEKWFGLDLTEKQG
ncbi:MAG TPA: transporter substrate-binding domain-containing protein [Candidatus Limnocylindrales bacterium]|nr:transporter substrate-binding domain-containing protein [Candidatus Limnocylindrales bacterium]